MIDEEVEKILREQEDRCREVLGANRKGLDLVARALLEHETIDGDEVQRLIEVGRSGAAPESVVTRGADTSRFAEPTQYTGNGGSETEGETEPAGARPITHTPPN